MSEALSIYNTGFDYLMSGERDKAIEAFRHAVALDSDLAIAWNGLSIALGQAGDLEGALDSAQRLAELEPEDALSHANLSRLLRQAGRIDDAEAELAIATRLETQQQSD